MYVLCVVSGCCFCLQCPYIRTLHICNVFSCICLCAVCVVCVCRFVQFADSGYEADPEIDRIEQQVSQCC